MSITSQQTSLKKEDGNIAKNKIRQAQEVMTHLAFWLK